MGDQLFSERRGTPRRIELRDLASLIWSHLARLRTDGYFDEALFVHRDESGKDAEPRIPAADKHFLRRLKESDVYKAVEDPTRGAPVSCHFHDDVLWDTLELLHAEVVAAPAVISLSATTTYDRELGQAALRASVNPELALHEPPLEMLPNGHIVERPPAELRSLLTEPISDDVPKALAGPLQAAIDQFTARGATDHDKRAALKHLTDVLEPLRKQIDEFLLPKDESDLFQIANGFYVRHLNRSQQRVYDGDVWLDWMFYVYVATARALLKVLDRQTLSDSVSPELDDGGGLLF